MYCIGCGEPIRVTTGKCPSCRTAIVGAHLEETISVNYGTSVVVPPVCCCCLAPRNDNRQEEISSVTFRMESLPGSGATSHENFRRLARHLKAKNPGVRIEPESVAYLEEAKGFPSALPTADALVLYESQFGVLPTEAR